MSFSKHIEYAYGNEMKQYEMFVGKCQRKTFLEWNNTYKQDSEYLKILQLNENMKNTFISKPRKLIPLFQTPLDLKKRSLDNIRDGLLFKNLNNQFEKKESPVQELKLLNYLFSNYTKKNNYKGYKK